MSYFGVKNKPSFCLKQSNACLFFKGCEHLLLSILTMQIYKNLEIFQILEGFLAVDLRIVSI